MVIPQTISLPTLPAPGKAQRASAAHVLSGQPKSPEASCGAQAEAASKPARSSDWPVVVLAHSGGSSARHQPVAERRSRRDPRWATKKFAPPANGECATCMRALPEHDPLDVTGNEAHAPAKRSCRLEPMRAAGESCVARSERGLHRHGGSRGGSRVSSSRNRNLTRSIVGTRGWDSQSRR